ncbi:MAG: TIM barrel protein [Candidatus Pacearchaeota archaeon]|nr:TIM barrel protein [Candidatus Pacearchaeota archaeon]
MKQQVRFGPSGIGSVKEALNNLQFYKKQGISAAEVEFTYGVYIKNNSDAELIGKEAKKLDIALSIHAPYYINLASEDKKIRESSKNRILECCERGHYFGTKERPTPIVFHAAYYGKYTREECYEIVKQSILEMQQIIKKKKWQVFLAPETTGKASQFGSLDELLKLAKETGCSFCVDFAHLEAREQKIDYKEIFDKLKKLKHVQAHFSGIEYTSKGERRHKVTTESKLKELLRWIKKYNLSITIINESPAPYTDSLKGLKIWKSLEQRA